MLSTFFKPIILQRPFCAIAGVLGGLLLTQAVNYELLLNSGGSFASQTYSQWQKDTGMTREEIDAALAIAVEQKIIQVDTSTQKHYPELIRFRVNHSVVDAKLSAIGEVVEPEKKESVEPIEETAEQLPLSMPGSGGELVLVGEPSAPKIDVKKMTDAQINEVFFPVYQQHKFNNWATHEAIPSKSIPAIRKFIKEKKFKTVEDAITGFADVLIWCREGSNPFYRNIHRMPLTTITNNGKLPTLFDSARDAMQSDPEYRSKVLDSSKSMDVQKVAPGIVPEQVKQAQAALEIYRQQQEATPTIIIHEDTGSLWR